MIFLVVCVLGVIFCIHILDTSKKNKQKNRKKRQVNIVQKQKSNKDNAEQVQVGIVINNEDKIDADELTQRLSTMNFGDTYGSFIYGRRNRASGYMNNSFTYTTCENEDNDD